MWVVEFFAEFEAEFDRYPPSVQDAIYSRMVLLQREGPRLGRPHADTLKASRHPNMKELRCSAGDGIWRIAFAFDPDRRGILLVAGDKSGVGEKRFYRQLIAEADARFDRHLAQRKG